MDRQVTLFLGVLGRAKHVPIVLTSAVLPMSIEVVRPFLGPSNPTVPLVPVAAGAMVTRLAPLPTSIPMHVGNLSILVAVPPK